MKVIDWIKKVIGILKDSAELIKIGLIIALGIFLFISLRTCKKEKEDNKQSQIILNSEQKKFTTELNNKAVEISQWKISTKELRSVNENLATKNNVYLNEISKAKQTIKELDLKLKNVKNYQNLDFTSSDTVYTGLIINCDSLVIEPIREENIDIDFLRVNDSLRVNWFFHDGFTIIADVRAKLKDNGKKHFLFPNAGWLWGWENKSTVVVKGKNSEITNYVEIKFTK